MNPMIRIRTLLLSRNPANFIALFSLLLGAAKYRATPLMAMATPRRAIRLLTIG